MGFNLLNFNGTDYPAWQADGNAARWIRPLQYELLSGHGLDIGYCKEDWRFPEALGIDPAVDIGWDAMNLPLYGNEKWDYITSSHCLEHVKENWYNVLDYWLSKIKPGGMLLLYLPHKSQEYWLPRNNRKHVHSFDGSEIGSYLRELGHKVHVSGCDHNHSFTVICEVK